MYLEIKMKGSDHSQSCLLLSLGARKGFCCIFSPSILGLCAPSGQHQVLLCQPVSPCRTTAVRELGGWPRPRGLTRKGRPLGQSCPASLPSVCWFIVVPIYLLPPRPETKLPYFLQYLCARRHGIFFGSYFPITQAIEKIS